MSPFAQEVCTSAADAAGEPSRLAFQGRAPLALFLRRTLLSFRKLAFAAVSRICDAVAWALADPAAPPPHAPAAIQRYADHSAHQLPHLLATHTPDELIASLPADATDAPRKRLLDALLQAENGEVEAAVDRSAPASDTTRSRADPCAPSIQRARLL